MRAVISLSLLVFIAACGYKGPLYLPGSKPPPRAPQQSTNPAPTPSAPADAGVTPTP